MAVNRPEGVTPAHRQATISTFIHRSPAEEEVEVFSVKVKCLVLSVVRQRHRRQSLEPAVDFTVSLRHLVTHNISLQFK